MINKLKTGFNFGPRLLRKLEDLKKESANIFLAYIH